jgi:predicted transcriptional regulator
MKGKELRMEILQRIESNWPTHIRELIRDLGFEVDNTNIKKFSYHIRKLEGAERVKVKRIGRALVAWPTDMEKLRIIHEMLKVE